MSTIRSSTAPIDVRQLGAVDYQVAWQLQRELADARVAGGTDTLLLLEHPAVYTAGRRTLAQERPTDGTPVIDTDRGGKITWHGPGQLVGYPIITLAEPLHLIVGSKVEHNEVGTFSLSELDRRPTCRRLENLPRFI